VKLKPYSYRFKMCPQGLVTSILKCEPTGLQFNEKEKVKVRLFTCYISDEPELIQVTCV